MCTVTLSYDQKNKQAKDMLATIISSGLFYVNDVPEKKDRVYIKNGEVQFDIAEEFTDLEEFRSLLHEMVDLEYSLP